MKERIVILPVLVAVFLSGALNAETDSRQFVPLPEKMQQHMLSNMRDHLQSINKILLHLANKEMDKAAELAEQRLGMSSLDDHGAAHMAGLMPEGMRKAGTAMHKSASRFALKAQEGDVLPAYEALADVTTACVACHAGYRIH